MDLEDWISVVGPTVGVLGFLLALYNLWRTIGLARETREISYAQRKSEALKLISDGESACMSVQRLLLTTQYAAEDASLAEIAADAERFMRDYDSYIERLSTARTALMAIRASGKSHEELVRLVEDVITSVADLTHAKKLEEHAQVTFLQPAARNIALTLRARLEENESARGRLSDRADR